MKGKRKQEQEEVIMRKGHEGAMKRDEEDRRSQREDVLYFSKAHAGLLSVKLISFRDAIFT